MRATALALLLCACGGEDPPPSALPPLPGDTPATRHSAGPIHPQPVVEGAARNAVVLVIDTLRADVLSEVDTPNLDSVAARSAGTWTVPSVLAILTGRPVRMHGWDLPSARIGHYPPLPELPTLATVLHDAGFTTQGLFSNPYLSEELGFDRGFDDWRRIVDKLAPERVTAEVATWGDDRPHFLYVHILGPHSPLRPSDAAREKYGVDASWIDPKRGMDVGMAKRNKPDGAREAYAAAYRAVVEDTDALVGQILAGLAPAMEDTLLVVTADHGELLGDHGIVGHGTHVWEPLTHVPLMVAGPGAPKLPDTLGIASIPALVCDGLGVAHEFPTRSDTSSPLVSQREGLLAMTLDGRTKAIWQEGRAEVFDLVADPGEEHPSPADAAWEARRAAWEAATPQGVLRGDELELSPDRLEELRELGYVE